MDNIEGIVNGVIIFLMIYFIIYIMVYTPLSNVYMLTSKRISIRRGWLSTEVNTYSYEKITDIFISQDILQRFVFDIGYIKIDTAGEDVNTIELHDIRHPEKLKAKILSLKDGVYKDFVGKVSEPASAE